jgi:hypothetical protein
MYFFINVSTWLLLTFASGWGFQWNIVGMTNKNDSTSIISLRSRDDFFQLFNYFPLKQNKLKSIRTWSEQVKNWGFERGCRCLMVSVVSFSDQNHPWKRCRNIFLEIENCNKKIICVSIIYNVDFSSPHKLSFFYRLKIDCLLFRWLITTIIV